MSKKHFEAIAAALRKLPDDFTKGEIVHAMARVCTESNPRFDKYRFIDACYIKEEGK